MLAFTGVLCLAGGAQMRMFQLNRKMDPLVARAGKNNRGRKSAARVGHVTAAATDDHVEPGGGRASL